VLQRRKGSQPVATHPLRPKDQLGEDLWTLVEAIDAPLVNVTCVSSLPSLVSQRGAFRIGLADGRVLKGRRVESTTDAERIEELSRLLDHRNFPRVLARRGCALLTEWIEGRPLAASDCHSDLFRRCGALQGALHSIPIAPLPARRHSQDWQARLDEKIAVLVRHNALGRRDGKDALELAIANAPDFFAVGLSHGDFCLENMVVTPPDHVYVVDNESLLIGAYDHDLARTWYRWPMHPSEREAYFMGYEEYRSAVTFGAHFLHWAVLALVESALFRVRYETRGVRVPIRRLKALLRYLRGRVSEDRATPLWAQVS
jgi:aminoglycoside phosphotransferase